MKKLHLLCNAHIDPVWLWEWEEGVATAISTFRVAADFCEQFDGFVFNHNEVILYKWVEEYEPELFIRIRQLVQLGKWNIMGGWYLQPDCNMPSGESLVRQILLGRQYFFEKFGVRPTTAINFDPFGHSRGLVQILNKSGYDSYIFCRPSQGDVDIPDGDFLWVGYDGSTVIGHHAAEFYNSALGKADEKVLKWMEQNADKPFGMVLWGVGNHGGGPSQVDLTRLQTLMTDSREWSIMHSTPERYIAEIKVNTTVLPRHERDLNTVNPGCYTSQIRLKQKHRLLENEIYMLEKMASHASIQGYARYPEVEIHEALCDLMMSEFHDILPGTSIQPVEETSLRLLDHGLEIVSRAKARMFFALTQGQRKAREGEIPILVYNPHPYTVQGIFECEFQLPDQNWNEEFSMPLVYRNGTLIPSQPEKEHSNLNLDWRKRIVFFAHLEPATINRFDCRIAVLPGRPRPELKLENRMIDFFTPELHVGINGQTGLMDCLEFQGVNYVLPNSFMPLVIEDTDDPWGMEVADFRTVIDHFELMSPEEGSKFSGIHGQVVDSVRVIEDGDVRTVIEAVLRYGHSSIVLTYKLPKHGTEVEVNVRVFWNEKSRLLKISVPTPFLDGHILGQVAYGIESLPANGSEAISQKWQALVSDRDECALTVVNDGIYGSDFMNGELRLTLLRSPGYSGHPILDRPIMRDDRFSPRIDQGERVFRFWLEPGPTRHRLDTIDREALAHNEEPYVLSFFPHGSGEQPLPGVILEDNTVLMTAFKCGEGSSDYVIRLFEPTGSARTTKLSVPALGLECEVSLTGFEIKTYRLNIRGRTLEQTNLMEESI